MKPSLPQDAESGPGQRDSRWASSLEVRQLRVLLAVVEHESVSAAALALGLAQSTVSETLAALDRAVGTPTIIRKRGAHRVTLTATGETLLPYARAVLQQLDDAQRAVATVTRRARARINVIANESVSTYLLPPSLGGLRRRWPNTGFSVSVGTCDDVRSGIASGRSDLGLLLEEDKAPPSPGDPPARPVPPGAARLILARAIPLILFAGQRHPLVRQETLTVVQRSALGPFTLFVSDAAGDFADLLRNYFGEGDLPGPRLEATGSIEGVKRGVSDDENALGILPQYAVAEELQGGRWRAMPLSPSTPRMRLVALLPGGDRRHPAIAELLEELGAPQPAAGPPPGDK